MPKRYAAFVNALLVALDNQKNARIPKNRFPFVSALALCCMIFTINDFYDKKASGFR